AYLQNLARMGRTFYPQAPLFTRSFAQTRALAASPYTTYGRHRAHQRIQRLTKPRQGREAVAGIDRRHRRGDREILPADPPADQPVIGAHRLLHPAPEFLRLALVIDKGARHPAAGLDQIKGGAARPACGAELPAQVEGPRRGETVGLCPRLRLRAVLGGAAFLAAQMAQAEFALIDRQLRPALARAGRLAQHAILHMVGADHRRADHYFIFWRLTDLRLQFLLRLHS